MYLFPLIYILFYLTILTSTKTGVIKYVQFLI